MKNNIFKPLKVQDTLKMELRDQDVKIISKALETYMRGRLGQFDYMIQEMFPKESLKMSFAKRKELSQIMRNYIFGEDSELAKNSNMSKGIYQENEETILGYNIYKILREYIAVKNNKGYWNKAFVDFNGCLKGEDHPKNNFKAYIEYKIEDEEENSKILKHYRKKEYKKIWEIFAKHYEYILKGTYIKILKKKSKKEGIYFVIRVYCPEKEMIKLKKDN